MAEPHAGTIRYVEGKEVRADGRIVGEFSVDVTDPDFAANMFISMAER
jgi:hypothetical protein